ncbi:MAG: carbamoyltransferase [Deltaproteobacteria bacterium]|nr:carbamoyltransferase [Deltaproteobacteria bacterium]
MHILGISAFYHDSAASLIKDGDIIASAQEERFTRKKHDPSFPINAVKFCLNYSGISLNEVDAIVFYDKPFLKFERLLETYYAFAPRGWRSFLSAIPIWLKEKLFLKKLIYDELSKIDEIDKKKIRLLFTEHHLSHAASAFFPSPFKESTILTIDGVGEWATASISHGKDNSITILKELTFPHSLGLLYSAFTYYLGFKVNSGEYKLMGLAPYGDPTSERVKRYKDLICSNLIDIKDDGSIWLNQEYFDYATGLKMVNDEKFTELFGVARRKPESDLLQEHCDMALAIQMVTEDIVFKMANEAQKLTRSRNLCMAGGVALNCVANGRLLKSKLFDDIWIQPAAGDAGGALGAAYTAYHIYYNKSRATDGKNDRMQGSYLGPEFSSLDVELMARTYKARHTFYDDFESLCEKTAELLDKGYAIGWFQGRMEWGPRALGNRSIIGDARSPEMQKKLNLKIKFRESFRPFAPSVLYEDEGEYFETDHPSPYMLLIADVLEKRRNPLPDGYHSMPVREKLYYLRSDIPAITHLDYSARLQTVHKETNEKYWKLIQAFKKRTGYGVIVNTSFNVRGEPIVCTPEDADKCFMRTEMKYLVVGNFIFDKKDQPEWSEAIDWREEYGLD